MAADRRVTRTKAALTAALFELLGEKDFSKISVTELTRRADVDRKTFYLHYQTVDEILEEFYEDSLRALRESIDREGIFRTESVDMTAFSGCCASWPTGICRCFAVWLEGAVTPTIWSGAHPSAADGIENFTAGREYTVNRSYGF